MEHLQHFGLPQDPFQNEPDLRFYFESASHADAQRRVERGLRQAKGLSVLTGDSGTGKSLLARRILEQLEEEMFDASLMVMVKGAASGSSLLERYAGQLEIEEPAADQRALMGQVYEQLAVIREDGRHAVLIIDDAQDLTADALGEIAGLLNLEYEDRRLLSILLVGMPQLDVALSHESGLSQRVDVRVRLQPLDLENAQAYVTHRLRSAGGNLAIVPEEALTALFKFGRGRPRLLNTLADNALFEAYLGGRHALTGLDVERAAGDLGIGSDPGSTYTAATPAHGLPGPPVLGPAGLSLEEAPDLLSGTQDEAPVMNLDSDEPRTLLGDPSASSSASASDSDSALDLGAALLDDSDDESSLSELELSLDGGSSSGELPLFAAVNDTSPGQAEATRLALPDEDAADGEIDDLFVELVDE